MLLFFLLSVTTVSEESRKYWLSRKIPQATQLQKIQKKTLFLILYVPGNQKEYVLCMVRAKNSGKTMCLINTSDIVLWVNQEKDTSLKLGKSQIWISLKV